jgi:hypothetical protein
VGSILIRNLYNCWHIILTILWFKFIMQLYIGISIQFGVILKFVKNMATIHNQWKYWTNELLIPQDNQTQQASSSVISTFK